MKYDFGGWVLSFMNLYSVLYELKIRQRDGIWLTETVCSTSQGEQQEQQEQQHSTP